jgi:hypothetical protein
MTDSEKKVIREFATFDESKREEAIAIHRKHLGEGAPVPCIEQQFMSEIDTPCPDLRLRHNLRLQLWNMREESR